MKLIKDFVMIILISFIISLLVYVSLIPEDKKPRTFGEVSLELFR